MDKLRQELLGAIKGYVDEIVKPYAQEVSQLKEKMASLVSENNSLKEQVSSFQKIEVINGKDGCDGKDGKDFDIKTAKEILDVMFEPYRIKLDSIKNGVDGKDGRDGRDGKDGINGKDGSSAFEIAKKHGYAGTELEFATAQFGKDGRDGVDGKNGEKGLDGKDGLGFDDLKVDFDGERKVSLKFAAEGNIKEYSFSIPAQIYKGVYQKGHSYVVGDTVTDNGSLWSCISPTSERPLSSENWQLAVKQGRAGEKGASGLTAYDLAVKNGFKGSEKEYLAEVRRGIRV